jgi:DNA processing protein
VLFVRGRLESITGRRVGIVGTRNPTATGRDVATELGRDLASVGLHIVSGLARGIDGAAHRGALDVHGVGPVGVVASGLDVVYPREHRGLWDAVAERGVLLSEAPPGTPPEPYRFPLRNRIIAALSEVLVVVESREVGGSLITAREALARNVDVLAVPGSVRNRAASGCNTLLREGAGVAVDAADVMVALELISSRDEAGLLARAGPAGLDAAGRQVFRCCAEPCTLEQLALRTGLALERCALVATHLTDAGVLTQRDGWFEQAAGTFHRRQHESE